MQIRTIPLAQINNSPHNPRRVFDDESLQSLAGSIARLGVLQPILVQKSAEGERYEIIAGERRWRASKIAELAEIPAIVVELGESVVHEVQLIENLEREQLNPIDEAVALQALKDHFGYSDLAVANRLKRSYGFVRGRLELLRLAHEIQDAIVRGQVSIGAALELSKLEDPADQMYVAQQVIDEGLTATATNARVNSYRFQQRLIASKESRRLRLLQKEEALAAQGVVITSETFDPVLHHRVWDLAFDACQQCQLKGQFLRADGQIEMICVQADCYDTLLARQRHLTRQTTYAQEQSRRKALAQVLDSEDVSSAHLQYLLWMLVQLMGAAADGWRAEVGLALFGEGASPDATSWEAIAEWPDETILTHILQLTVSTIAGFSNQSLPRGLRESLASQFGISRELLGLESAATAYDERAWMGR